MQIVNTVLKLVFNLFAIVKLLAFVKLRQAPEFALAVYEAELVCPEAFCREGKAALITRTDTGGMVNPLKADVLKTRDLMKAADEWLTSLGDRTAAVHRICTAAPCTA